MKNQESVLRQILKPVVIVGALGYFVDVYDLILFAILRVPSLKDMGFTGDQLVSHGVFLLNMQMFGMLIGGIFFGILGDRIGRVALLFGSILLYSIANIAGWANWVFIRRLAASGVLAPG